MEKSNCLNEHTNYTNIDRFTELFCLHKNQNSIDKSYSGGYKQHNQTEQRGFGSWSSWLPTEWQENQGKL